MTLRVAVMGGGPRAAGWATRFLAAGLDVVATDPALPRAIAERWTDAERLGLFPGASIDRLRICDDPDVLAEADLVQVVDATLTPPPGARMTATDATAMAYEPIHLLPLVELADGPDRDALAAHYSSIGMSPLPRSAPEAERERLGRGLADVAAGDPGAIVAVLRALRATGVGAGPAMAEHEARRLAAQEISAWRPGDRPEAPLRLYATRVEPDWVDYNGHMTEAAYLTAAGWASDALFRYIGDDEEYRAAGHSFYTVETHVVYLREVDVHEPIEVSTQVLGVDHKRVHLVHEMVHGDTGARLATVEQMLVHVDMTAARSAPILPGVAAALDAIASAHAPLPHPPEVGNVMHLPPPRRAG